MGTSGIDPIAPPQYLRLRRPDDWHVHLRDGALLQAVAPATARSFARAIVMPNLSPPITTVAAAVAYGARIRAALPDGSDFTPLLTAYLTDTIAAEEIAHGHAEGVFTACKLYPAHATTNAAAGVTDLARIEAVLATMERIGMPLLIHGEVTDAEIDIFDREAVFIERHLAPLLQRHPGLKVVLEHITTAESVAFVREAGPNLAATITPHHLHINRNAMFQGGLRPDFYCLPVAKRERHRLALRQAATSGEPCFFLGTDSAPHPRSAKESACGCAGIYNAPYALESYAAVFEQEGALDRLEAFASLHGPAFYGLPLNEGTITLVRQAHTVPPRLHKNAADGSATELVPFHAGQVLQWRLEGEG
ncbi:MULTISPECIES: dihydroorotase [unclassified Cyanobium]|uniref:dihydroorotase n=1 Tax=unclassified Cyanobium TaxID=2627006 RepID=UPI0020CC0262|nr:MULTISPECIES: dihydroorotase [unclassified Cyanobium]MCP9834527.1 dihydroorotase [Cyanobium sp. La Preciosa 7G6]MCP9937290.1 dihydroorotase [Cyanobium sp. Aljojuca 7A6]